MRCNEEKVVLETTEKSMNRCGDLKTETIENFLNLDVMGRLCGTRDGRD